jgi:eukaryotic-like serine/threonine-protein kinase
VCSESKNRQLSGMMESPSYNPPTAMSLGPGTRVGRYEVIAPLGAGGMGEVYRARDPQLGRDVALKFLPPAFADDADRLMRFDREARTLASLNHPHIAQVYGIEEGTSDTGRVGRAIAMELVEGEDLSERIGRGPIPIDESLPIARQIADALEAAHELGVIHRDLKPANIKLRHDGTVKVLDFGLARGAEGRGASGVGGGFDAATITSPVMTAHGTILGTAAYMSPEQAKGKPVDKRVDIWAFGCVLYEMLTGTMAFAGDSVSETLAAVLKEQPALDRLPVGTSPAITRVLRRCLEKDPARRLRDIADARFDLEQVVAGDADAPPNPAVARANDGSRLAWTRAAGWVLAGATIGAIAVAAYTRRNEPAATPVVSRLTIVPSADALLATDAATPDMAISADGRRVFYQARRTDADGLRHSAVQLVSRPLDAFEATPLANLGLFPVAPFASPDGAWIGFQTSMGPGLAPSLARVATGGGTMTTVTDLAPLGTLRGGAWTHDGGLVFATSQLATGLFRATTAGDPPTLLTKPTQGERDHLWPEVLPDNAGVLFTIVRDDSTFDVAVLPTGSTTWRPLARGGSAPKYLPNGSIVYAAAGTLYGVGFDVRSLQVTTEPVPLVEGILTKPSGAANFAVAGNGTLAYVAGGQREALYRIVWLNRDGTTTALPIEPRAYRRPRLSPDGRQVAVSLEERGIVSIWLYDLARETFTRLTPRGEFVGDPLWSADGRQIAYWSRTQRGIFTMAVDGSDQPVRLTSLESGIQYADAWSADGSTIAFIQDESGIKLFTVSTRPPHDIRPLTSGPGANVEAAFSPDGRWVTHVAFDGNVAELVIGPTSVPERRWPIASSGRYPIWSADGKDVLFVDADAIHRIAIDANTGRPSGKPAKVMNIPTSLLGLRHLNPSADGKRFLMAERVQSEDTPSEIRVVLNWLEEVRGKMAGATALKK